MNGTELSPICPFVLLCLCVAVIALVFIVGGRCFRPTCNRCPICERVTGTPASLTPEGDPYVCGHDICDDCLSEFDARLADE